jgi:hypothetical protein
MPNIFQVNKTGLSQESYLRKPDHRMPIQEMPPVEYYKVNPRTDESRTQSKSDRSKSHSLQLIDRDVYQEKLRCFGYSAPDSISYGLNNHLHYTFFILF